MDELERQEQLLREAMRELQESSTVTADTFFRLDKETSKLGKSIEKAEEAIDRFWRGPIGKTTKAGGDLAKGFVSSGQAARQNRESFESLNPVIQGAASALSAIPIVGDALGKTLSTVGTFVTAELQKSVEAFQTLGSVGGVGAEGVMGLRKSAELAGLSFDQLAKITSNKSGGLAFAFGTTANGLKAIAQLTKAAEPFRGQLLALGFGMQQQSEIFADYMERSARLGRRQTTDVRVLGQQSAEYAKNLSRLSRLTGMSADSVQSALDAQLSNIRFRRAVAGLPQTAQDAVSNFGIAVAGLSKDPNFVRGIEDLVAGQGTAAATAVTVATGNAAQGIIDRLKAGVIGEEQAYNELKAATADIYARTPAQVFGRGSVLDEAALGIANVATSSVDFAAALKQGEGAAKALDPSTKGMVDAQLSLQRFAVEMDTFVNNKVFPRAVDVIGVLTDKLADLGGMVNQVASGNLSGNGGGYSIGDYNPFDPANWARAFGFQARADGGPVGAGNPYLVGEQGPELMVPTTHGTVVDASKTDQIIDDADKKDQIIEAYLAQAKNIPIMKSMPYDFRGQTEMFPDPTSSGRMPSLRDMVTHFMWEAHGGQGSWFDYRFDKASVRSLGSLINLGRGYNESTSPFALRLLTAGYQGAYNWKDYDLNSDGYMDIIEQGVVRALTSAGPDWYESAIKGNHLYGYKNGGIASGPKSGYSALLHGTEAVVPLPDGKNIPVQNTDGGMKTDEQLKLMGQQISRLDSLISLMQSQNDTSKKMLRASTA